MKTIILGLGIALCMLTFTGCEKEDYTDTTDNSQSYTGYGAPNNDKDEQLIDTIQNMLDSGKTPIEIYKEGVPVKDIYGKKFRVGYREGLITYLDTLSGDGLLVSNGTIGSEDNQHKASTKCGNYGHGWRLPSKKEIYIIDDNIVKSGVRSFGRVWYSGSSSFGNVYDFTDGSIYAKAAVRIPCLAVKNFKSHNKSNTIDDYFEGNW